MLTFLLWLFQWLLKDDSGHLPQLLGPGQDFMACVIGAGMLGFGIGIVFCNNGSTGGTDIIAWIINKYKDVRHRHHLVVLFHLPRLAARALRLLRALHHEHRD